MHDNWTPERLADRMQIQETLYLYCRAIDRIDSDLLRTVFHPDVEIDRGDVCIDRETFVRNVAKRHPTVPYATHQVMNFLIDFLAPDRAFVESYCLALEQHPPAETSAPTVDRIYRVRYGDTFERRAGVWRIGHRMMVIDHVQDAAIDPSLVQPLPLQNVGQRNANDPIQLKRRTLGVI